MMITIGSLPQLTSMSTMYEMSEVISRCLPSQIIGVNNFVQGLHTVLRARFELTTLRWHGNDPTATPLRPGLFLGL